MMFVISTLVLLAVVDARSLSSLPGERTSQMGYNSWYDVMMSPSSTSLLATASAMATNGLQAAGYTYVNLDDGIVEVARGPDGNLVPTAAMGSWKDLSDKLHAQNFYFGVYTDRGPKTCGGRASAQGYEAKDAAFYAANGVDYVKEDSCNAPQDHPTAFAMYNAMSQGINASGREMFFSLCGWEQWYSPVMRAIANSARIGPDDTNWNGVLSDIDDMLTLAPNGGPGGWNDPCLLLGADSRGNEAQTEQQSRFQFTAWAVLAAPMLLSQTIVNMSANRLETYLNREVIGVGQDVMGRQGILLAGGSLQLAPRSLHAHLHKRFNGAIPDPRKVIPAPMLAKWRGVGGGWRAAGGGTPTTTTNATASDSNTPLVLDTCTPGGSALQKWVWNVTGTNYVSNPATQLCMNTDDCGSGMIAFTCITSGDTCCGNGCLDNMRFILEADGTMRTPSQPGQCFTVPSIPGGQVTLTPCTGGPTQTFTHDSTTGQLTASASPNKGCLSVGGGQGSSKWAIIGRPLVDGSWALGFFNAGALPADLVCGSECLAGMGFESSQGFAVRDLWAHTELSPILPGANVTVPGLAGNGGVALLKLTPIFTAPIPPPPSDL